MRDDGNVFQVKFGDGRILSYPTQFRDRVLYAVSNLEQTPLIHELGIESIAEEGKVIWPAASYGNPF